MKASFRPDEVFDQLSAVSREYWSNAEHYACVNVTPPPTQRQTVVQCTHSSVTFNLITNN